MSIKFPPAILGPEMAAPILWAPGIFWFFLLENPNAHKVPPVRGGGAWVFLEGGVGKCQFYFYGRGDFSQKRQHTIVDEENKKHLQGTIPNSTWTSSWQLTDLQSLGWSGFWSEFFSDRGLSFRPRGQKHRGRGRRMSSFSLIFCKKPGRRNSRASTNSPSKI